MIKRAKLLTIETVRVTDDGKSTFAERFRDRRINIMVQVLTYSIFIGTAVMFGNASPVPARPSLIDQYFNLFAFTVWLLIVLFTVWSETHPSPGLTMEEVRERNRKTIQEAEDIG